MLLPPSSKTSRPPVLQRTDMFPNDPMILLGFINTKLRDDFDSFARLCEVLDANPEEITQKLASIDYFYDEALNKFV